MGERKSRIAADDRFDKFEYPNDDFPYYNGIPTEISVAQWLWVMAAVVLGFFALVTPIPFVTGDIGGFIHAILFFAIPLVGLAIVAGKQWTALFRKVSGRDIMWMVAFALLNMVATILVGYFVMTFLGAASNPALSGLGELDSSRRVLFFLKTAPQLFGEEVLSILPFLAILYFSYSRMRRSRKMSIVIAWLAAAIIFGAAHLPTYDWNLIQCFVVIGTARLVLTLAYIKTKNLWVSTGAHILNDWTFFALTILGASVAAG